MFFCHFLSLSLYFFPVHTLNNIDIYILHITKEKRAKKKTPTVFRDEEVYLCDNENQFQSARLLPLQLYLVYVYLVSCTVFFLSSILSVSHTLFLRLYSVFYKCENCVLNRSKWIELIEVNKHLMNFFALNGIYLTKFSCKYIHRSVIVVCWCVCVVARVFFVVVVVHSSDPVRCMHFESIVSLFHTLLHRYDRFNFLAVICSLSVSQLLLSL